MLYKITLQRYQYSAANDFITYTLLNANIDIVQDNVATLNTNMVANLASNDFITYTAAIAT